MMCTTSLFQFQYGAIKGEIVQVTIYNGSGFQFQYGAIKGIYFCFCRSYSALFQFQYGAIKGSGNKARGCG